MMPSDVKNVVDSSAMNKIVEKLNRQFYMFIVRISDIGQTKQFIESILVDVLDRHVREWMRNIGYEASDGARFSSSGPLVIIMWRFNGFRLFAKAIIGDSSLGNFIMSGITFVICPEKTQCGENELVEK